MAERPKWDRGAISASKSFERAWEICSQPDNHTSEEISWAADFFSSQTPNYRTGILLGGTGDVPAEILDKVFMGIYHRNLETPLELKYHPNSN